MCSGTVGILSSADTSYSQVRRSTAQVTDTSQPAAKGGAARGGAAPWVVVGELAVLY